MNKEQIIKALSDRQKKLGWSVYRLKKETGLTKQMKNPTLENLVKIADALGLVIKIEALKSSK